jgi:hypothetical protein
MAHGAVVKKIAVVFLLALSLCGCATTYVPISWNFGDKVQELSRSDLTLAMLFDRYDPQRLTLRVKGDSFDEVMMPSEVQYHLGAYRRDTKLIYRNLYQDYNDQNLRDLMVHEFAHHIWYNFMSRAQQQHWADHLQSDPTPLQNMVRQVYRRPADFATEDFAFTVEFARPSDLIELARMKIITPQECETLLAEQRRSHPGAAARGNAQLHLGSPEKTAQ